MEVWLIRNGEKSGPFHDYEIRQKISAGDIDPDVPAWHEGMSAWLPIADIPLFKSEFEAKPASPSPAPGPSSASPPPLPEPPNIARRFWARWLDIHLYYAAWWLTLWASGRNIEHVLSSPLIILPRLIPWFILEAFLIHRYGATIGKALLGLRVVNHDGSKLTLAMSTRRSLRVLVAGVGFGFDLVAVVCQILSLVTTIRLGKPLWDHLGNHRLVAVPIGPFRIIAVIVLFLVAVQLQMAVLAPYYARFVAKTFPELRSQLYPKPLWQLPPRHPLSPETGAPPP